MTKIVNSLRILATTDSGLLSWQRSARMAVAKAADEIEQLREALVAFQEAKASVAGDSYDGVDEHTRDLLEHADVQASLALGSMPTKEQQGGQ